MTDDLLVGGAPASRRDRGWQIDRRTPVGALLLVAMRLGFGIWWASHIDDAKVDVGRLRR